MLKEDWGGFGRAKGTGAWEDESPGGGRARGEVLPGRARARPLVPAGSVCPSGVHSPLFTLGPRLASPARRPPASAVGCLTDTSSN